MSADQNSHVLQVSLPSSLDAYQKFVELILARLEQLGWPAQPDLFAIHMALEESISNAIRHGNEHDNSKRVEIECRLSPNKFWARICDEGEGFCLEEVPDCRKDECLDIPGGRGLALLKAYMTRVEYNESGNCLTLEKHRDGTAPTPK